MDGGFTGVMEAPAMENLLATKTNITTITTGIWDPSVTERKTCDETSYPPVSLTEYHGHKTRRGDLLLGI